jgi:uncharacterized membrane protein
MESKAKVLGHPVHPMLIVFPLGLLGASLIFDIIHLSVGNGRWADVAYWMLGTGIIGGLLAAVFGLIDFLAIPRGTRARFIGMWHGIGNVLVVGLFGVSWLLRRDAPTDPGILPVVISAIAVGLALVAAWLGGELVGRLGVGVADGAHLDAPSSLSRRPASERTPRQLPTTGDPAQSRGPRAVGLTEPRQARR